jgi:hypothetical protein
MYIDKRKSEDLPPLNNLFKCKSESNALGYYNVRITANGSKTAAQ